jgi:hypothetical protein
MLIEGPEFGRSLEMSQARLTVFMYSYFIDVLVMCCFEHGSEASDRINVAEFLKD